MTGRFHLQSAAGWAEYTVAGPGQIRRHAAHFSEKSSAFGFLNFALVLQPVLTTSTQVVAWPQGDQFLGGGLKHSFDRAMLGQPFWEAHPASLNSDE